MCIRTVVCVCACLCTFVCPSVCVNAFAPFLLPQTSTTMYSKSLRVVCVAICLLVSNSACVYFVRSEGNDYMNQIRKMSTSYTNVENILKQRSQYLRTVLTEQHQIPNKYAAEVCQIICTYSLCTEIRRQLFAIIATRWQQRRHTKRNSAKRPIQPSHPMPNDVSNLISISASYSQTQIFRRNSRRMSIA